MKDIIFDNLSSWNINLAKSKFLQSCYPMPTNMPMACKSFIKMIQQCSNNIIFDSSIIVRACFAACQRTQVLIGFAHVFHLQGSWTSQATKSMSLQGLSACRLHKARSATARKVWAKTICSIIGLPLAQRNLRRLQETETLLTIVVIIYMCNDEYLT